MIIPAEMAKYKTGVPHLKKKNAPIKPAMPRYAQTTVKTSLSVKIPEIRYLHFVFWVFFKYSFLLKFTCLISDL